MSYQPEPISIGKELLLITKQTNSEPYIEPRMKIMVLQPEVGYW